MPGKNEELGNFVTGKLSYLEEICFSEYKKYIKN